MAEICVLGIIFSLTASLDESEQSVILRVGDAHFVRYQLADVLRGDPGVRGERPGHDGRRGLVGDDHLDRGVRVGRAGRGGDRGARRERIRSGGGGRRKQEAPGITLIKPITSRH